MEPLTMLAIGSALGLGKSALIDAPREKRQRKLAAATQRYSPWTGLRANPIQEADPFGSALQFGATGASMGAAMQQSELDKALADRLNTGGSIRGYGKNLAAADSPWSSKYLGVNYSLED